MANTHHRSLEVTVISGEDLRINDRPIKNNAFVSVKSDSRGSPSSQDSTKPDARSASYPHWDEKLHVDLPADSQCLVVEVCCRSSTAGDKLVGTAWIPVSNFVGGYTPENYLHFLSYRLKDGKGRRNGIINISVRDVTSSYKGTAAISAEVADSWGSGEDRRDGDQRAGLVSQSMQILRNTGFDSELSVGKEDIGIDEFGIRRSGLVWSQK